MNQHSSVLLCITVLNFFLHITIFFTSVSFISSDKAYCGNYFLVCCTVIAGPMYKTAGIISYSNIR